MTSALNLDWFDADTVAEFMALVDRRGPHECWPWTGIVKDGLGVFDVWTDGRRHRLGAHRVMVMLDRGEPLEQYLTSMCGVEACCNPGHWRPTKRAKRVRPVPVVEPVVRHDWFGIIARVDAHPTGTVAKRVEDVLWHVHGHATPYRGERIRARRWDDLLAAVVADSRSAGALRDLYLHTYLRLGGVLAKAA